MKKRILTAVLAAALVTGTCAATVSAKEEKAYTIGICQLVQHDALDAATKGFEDAITEKMGDSVKFDEQNAQGDSNTCSTIINSFVSEGADLILANATASLQAAAAGTSDIPILGTAVTEYGVALGIDDFDGTVAETFPVHLTSLHLMSRLICFMNFSLMPRTWDFFTAPQNQTPSIR